MSTNWIEPVLVVRETRRGDVTHLDIVLGRCDLCGALTFTEDSEMHNGWHDTRDEL